MDAGTRLATYADAIAARTQLSRAFLGMVLLGVGTSLPEMATTDSGPRSWVHVALSHSPPPQP